MTVNDLVGIPYIKSGDKLTGADCWGIVLLAHEHLYDRVIPVLRNFYAGADKRATAAKVEIVSGNWAREDKAKNGDVVVMYDINNQPTHFGVFVDNHVLHSTKAHGASRIDRISVIIKQFKKLEFYRWQS